MPTWAAVLIVLIGVPLGIALSNLETRLDRQDRERNHDRLKPAVPATIRARVTEAGSLRGSITVDRDYRVRGVAYRSGSMWALDLPPLLRAGQRYEFQIERWLTGRQSPEPPRVRLRFWPPAKADGVKHWTCRCGRPTEGDELSPGHWELRAPVDCHADALDQPPADPPPPPRARPEKRPPVGARLPTVRAAAYDEAQRGDPVQTARDGTPSWQSS